MRQPQHGAPKTGRGSLRLMLVIALAMVALTLAAPAFPAGLTWGFHFLGFLPPAVAVAYAAAACLIVLAVVSGRAEKAVRALADATGRRPWVFVACVTLLYLAAAFLFRMRASVLGDSYTLMMNISDHHTGIAPLAPWSEPFSIFFLDAVASFLGPTDVAHLPDSIFAIELVLGVAFILCTAEIVRRIFTSPLHRVLALLLLVSLPYMEFYFGYVETYAPSMTATAVFVLLSVGILQGRMPFAPLPAAWAILTFLHYINGLYLPSVLYLAAREYRAGRRGTVMAGFAGMALVVLITFAAVGFRFDRLIDISPISHVLSFGGEISAVNSYSQAYDVWSVYHLGDILNYMVMMSPYVFVIIVVFALRSPLASIRRDPLAVWFLATCVPLFAYFLVAKLEQGTANDWDVFAVHVFPSSLFAAYVLSRPETRNATAAFTLLVLMTMLQSAVWFTLNATVEPQLRRFQSLWDKRVVSQLGHYTMALRLDRYFESQGNALRRIETWERYAELFPGDPRGYANAVDRISAAVPENCERTAGILGGWLAADPSNDLVRDAYWNACVGEGNRLYALGLLDSAQIWYARAILYDTAHAKPYNNLGGVLAEKGDLRNAIPLFRRAIALDSGYSDAYYNLGQALIDSKKPEEARKYLERAAELGSEAARDALHDEKSRRGIR